MPNPPPALVVGDIVTMDKARPRAEAMAVFGGFISAIGTRTEAAAALPAGVPVHHVPGTVVPGLIDSHLHLQWAGLKLLRLTGGAAIAPDEALGLLDAHPLSEVWTEARPPTSDQRQAALDAIQPVVHAAGITGVVDPALVPAELAAYVACHRRGRLSVRVVAMPHPNLEDGPEPAIAALDALGVRTGLGDDRLRLGGVKVYFDGIGMRATALRREPWPGRAGDTDGRGWQRVPTDAFQAIADYCARNGWSLGVHVVGGGGIDCVMDAFVRAAEHGPVAELGFTLIHAYLEPSPANLARAAELGVLVAAQPSIHWCNGAGLVRLLGPTAERANPVREWLAAGATVGGGSDGPYFPMDPRLGLWQLRTRHVADADVPHALDLALDAETALALYTTGAAAVSLDPRRGQLAPGCPADWAAFSSDPSAARPEEIRSMVALETAVGGRIVHQRSA